MLAEITQDRIVEMEEFHIDNIAVVLARNGIEPLTCKKAKFWQYNLNNEHQDRIQERLENGNFGEFDPILEE